VAWWCGYQEVILNDDTVVEVDSGTRLPGETPESVDAA
jgi:hypothetical protein